MCYYVDISFSAYVEAVYKKRKNPQSDAGDFTCAIVLVKLKVFQLKLA